MSKQDQSVSNLLYFEASSMKELYECMKSWQDKNHQFFFDLDIQKEGDKFCCIASIDPDDLRPEITKTKYEEALYRFQRKALRIIVKEKQIGAYIEFVDDTIPPEKILEIQSKLKQCTTAWEIKAVFGVEMLTAESNS